MTKPYAKYNASFQKKVDKKIHRLEKFISSRNGKHDMV